MEREKIRVDVLMVISSKLFRQVSVDTLSLLHPCNGFSALDLLYLLFEVEKHFSIRISEKHLINSGFFTIEKIVDIVQNQLA